MSLRTGAKSRALYVGLLRGINVGGKNKLPMKDLAAIFTDVGCEAVRTYIQSGNVLYQAEPSLALRLPELVAEAIAQRFELRVPLLTRTRDEIRDIVRRNPFPRAGADPATLHVVFLAEPPVAGRLQTLDPGRSPPDAFAVRGREIYLRLPNGAGRTRLTNDYFGSKLGTVSTLRNWRTVLKLLELSRSSRADY